MVYEAMVLFLSVPLLTGIESLSIYNQYIQGNIYEINAYAIGTG